MNNSSQIRVLDLAGTGLPHAVQQIYREWRAGTSVIALADDLLKRAEQLGLPPQPGTFATQLASSLDRSGIPFRLVDLQQTNLLNELRRGVVVAAGSDLCAASLARELGGTCRSIGEPGNGEPRDRKPLRIALLGCGTVGGGVLERLLARPDLFRVTGVTVRDLDRAERSWVPRHLLVRDPGALVERAADVVIELFGGIEPARSLIARALELGRSVVTANKALLADDIGPLSRLAARRGAALRFSASVGGALPALEAVRRAALAGRLQAISGVLNGTCNYILDQIGAGLSLDEAVAAAQEAGFAEADPLLDLDGSDAAQKLALLVREAFGTALDWRRIPRRGLTGLDRAVLDGVARRGRAVRLVASCERTAAGLRASVQPLEVALDHPFARICGADNALRIEPRSGESIDLTARGAGRWPTTEAVLADVYDLLAERRANAAPRCASVAEEVVA